jgi:hypothetical protein
MQDHVVVVVIGGNMAARWTCAVKQSTARGSRVEMSMLGISRVVGRGGNGPRL